MFSNSIFATLILMLLSSPSGASPIANETRSGRIFPGLLDLDLAVSHCGLTFLRCPSNCAIEEAVVLGYCCECPGYYGYLPIRCPLDMHCPPPEPLCSDYEYLMDCCCN